MFNSDGQYYLYANAVLTYLLNKEYSPGQIMTKILERPLRIKKIIKKSFIKNNLH